MILVDSSAWIDHLRDDETKAALRLRSLLMTPGELAVTEPIAMELLAGASPSSLNDIERLVNGLVSLPVDPRQHYRSAAALFRAVRHTGNTVRSLQGCLIAAVAIAHGVPLLHRDTDFLHIATVSSLVSEAPDLS